MPASSTTEATLTLTNQDERSLVFDLFHALNQPLASLHCALELAIQRSLGESPQDPDFLEQALQHTEEAAQLAEGIRELWQLSQMGKQCAAREFVDLADCLRKIVNDFLPVAEQAGMKLFLQSVGSCRVHFQPEQLREILFRVMDRTIDCGVAGETIQLLLVEKQVNAQLRISTSSVVKNWERDCESSGSGQAAACPRRFLKRRLLLAIARRQLEAAGGSLECEDLQTRRDLVCNFVLA